MKNGVYVMVFSFFAVLSCHTSKDAVVEDTESAKKTGTVAIDPDCGTYIKVIQGDVMRFYHPVNLEDKYKEEGTKLEFNFEEVKAKMAPGCEMMIPISVSDVKSIRED